jgi:hypothetical protein
MAMPAPSSVAPVPRSQESRCPRHRRFRLVLGGTSKFATNEYFPYVSNGELSVSMLRWLAADETTPSVPPQTYQFPEIVLTAGRCATCSSRWKCCFRSR